MSETSAKDDGFRCHSTHTKRYSRLGLQLRLTNDGFLILDCSKEPDYQWWIAGGPALCVDYEPSRTPEHVTDTLKASGILGKPIGIYRIVSQKPLADEVWSGKLPTASESQIFESSDVRLVVHLAGVSRVDLINRLTFGAFGSVLDAKISDPHDKFWVPHITRNMGFMNAARSNRRFINYLETSSHVEDAAWDQHAIFVRVQADLRRDFAHAFMPFLTAGSISFGEAQHRNAFFDRLTKLANTIDAFASLLRDQGDAQETVFHNFLANNSILLDVYADAISKPRFVYPPGAGPLGKAYVEPDFILNYADGTYKLIELERPNKDVATKQGHPRGEFTQASFQIAEWRHFIAIHYELIKAKFPGISLNPGAMLVISRSTTKSFGVGRRMDDYKGLLRAYLPNTEILTYDDLLDRATRAYVRLSTISSIV